MKQFYKSNDINHRFKLDIIPVNDREMAYLYDEYLLEPVGVEQYTGDPELIPEENTEVTIIESIHEKGTFKEIYEMYNNKLIELLDNCISKEDLTQRIGNRRYGWHMWGTNITTLLMLEDNTNPLEGYKHGIMISGCSNTIVDITVKVQSPAEDIELNFEENKYEAIL